MQNVQAQNIDEYIAAFPNDIQKLLRQMRTTIHKAAPKAEEAIKYAIPTFVLHGNLVHFAAFKNHIGFYPAPAGIAAFKKTSPSSKEVKAQLNFRLTNPCR